MALSSRKQNSEFNFYGIILLFVSFILRFLVVGTFQCIGIILRELVELYDVGKGELNWIPSVNQGCMLILAPLSGMIDEKIGNRLSTLIGGLLSTIGLVASMFVPNLHYLYLTYGVITGTGFSLVFQAATVQLNLYFKKKRALANSIANFGAGLGTSLLPFILTELLAFYGWRGTFTIMAGMFMQSCICAMLLRPMKHENTEKDKLLPQTQQTESVAEKPSIWDMTKRVFSNKFFIMYAVSAFSVMSVYPVPFLTIPTMMSTYGYSPRQQAMVITAAGLTSLIQRPLIGYIADQFKNYVFFIMGVAGIGLGLSTLSIAFMEAYPLFILYGVLNGIFAGTYTNLQPVALVDVVDRRSYGIGLGYFRFFIGIGIILGPPTAGWIVDARGKFDTAFFFAGILISFGGLLLIIVNIIIRYQHREPDHSEDKVIQLQDQDITAKQLSMGSTLSLS